MIDRAVIRPLLWTIRWLGTRTILSLALLLLALGSVALGLAHLIRSLDTGLVLPLAVVGVGLGWLLARSPLPGWLAGAVAIGLGIEMAVLRLELLYRPLAMLLRSLAELTWQGLHWPVNGAPDPSLVTPAVAELEREIGTLLDRTRDWWLAVMDGQAAFDPMPTMLAWSLVLWFAAVWAGWQVRRQQRPLLAVVPGGVLLAITLSYTWDDPLPLGAVLAATLLLMALTGHIAREGRWEATGLDFSPDLRIELAMVALLLSVLLLLAAFLAPSVSVRPLAESGRRLVVEHLRGGKQVADSMGLESRAGSGIALGRATAAGLPNRNLIGSGPELSEQIVMLVYPEGPQHSDEKGAPLPYYWRALTYDDYTGRGWQTTETIKEAYGAGESVALQAEFPDETVTTSAHRMLRQKVEAVVDAGGLLYTAGELLAADQGYTVAWRSHRDLFGAEIDAHVYRVDSLVPAVSEAQLRAAGNAYPDWVQERYLVLPPEAPARVLSLAHDLTSTAATNYDKARAIETYLRSFTYSLDVPAPPPNQEVADFFLFDLQRGYCDYYATTMVVLARAAGLPARLAVGYASGTYDEINARYIVSAADAHSWAEVYFPSYGWITFEPTGGRPPLDRPTALPPVQAAEPDDALEPITGRRVGLGRIVSLGTLGSLVLLGLAGLLWWCADSWRLRRMSPAEVVDTLYRRLYHHGRRLAVLTEAGDTPYEFAERLRERVTALAQDRRLGATATSTCQDVHWLTALCVRGLYSPQKPIAAERSQAIKTWQRLRGKLWLAWIWQRTRRKNGPEQ